MISEKNMSLALLKLKEICNELGGTFNAESNMSGTCYLPNKTNIDLIRVVGHVTGVTIPNKKYLEMYFSGIPRVFEIGCDEDIRVHIAGDALQEDEVVDISSSGGEIHKVKAEIISMRTDITGERIYVDIF